MLKRLFKQNSHNLLFRWLAGFGRSMNRIYENRNHDIRSNGELTVLRKLSTLQPAVIIDGGANTGHYTAAVRRTCPGATVYAFEPVTETYNQLLEKFKNDQQVVPVNLGLFSENTMRKIHLYPSSTHSSLYDIQGVPARVIAETSVELIRGDDFIQKEKIGRIGLLKLDLEGAEYDALLGFEKALQNQDIRAIQFEYGYVNITTKKLLIDFYTLLKKYGYILGKIYPKTVEFRTYTFKQEDFIGPNFIAVRQDDDELIRLLTRR